MRAAKLLFLAMFPAAPLYAQPPAPPAPPVYAQTVAAVPPDSTGNVAGIATVPMITAAAGDVPQYIASPTSGSTYQANPGTTILFINNSSLLVSATVGFPANPVDLQRFTAVSAAPITTMGFAGGTIKGSLGSGFANGFARFLYSATLGAWMRVG